MSTKPRESKVYVVTTPQGPRLVKAMSGAGAVKHVVVDTHSVSLASQSDLIKLLPTVTVEDATLEE